MKALTLSKFQKAQVMQSLYERADQFTFRFLLAYSIFGIGISGYYDTWLIGISTAALAIGSWFAFKLLLPTYSMHRYVASMFFGVFVGTFIYQMHGLFEMHFFAFIGSAILIVYQNWRYQLPLIGFIVVHHAVFAYLQYSGVSGVYFTQLEYMNLHTFVYHACLAITVVMVCGYWAYHFRKLTMADAAKSLELSNRMDLVHKMNKKLTRSQEELSVKNKELEATKSKLLDLTEKQANMYERLRKGVN